MLFSLIPPLATTIPSVTSPAMAFSLVSHDGILNTKPLIGMLSFSSLRDSVCTMVLYLGQGSFCSRCLCYLSKELHKVAKIVFAPYNYLIDACISEAQSCVGLCIDRRDKLNDKSRNPNDFAILKGMQLLMHALMGFYSVEEGMPIVW
ncbi:uncharacterized protein LOC129288045 isoform X2 [Prosopis cineraria]|nr:uncharacterized protein LOC129288045 isoform X2 [Prosopis cineraria]